MAFDAKPSTWLGAGYASSAGSHTITLNTNDAAANKTLPQLTDVEADPTTGDVRKLMYAVVEALYQAQNAVLAADRPEQMLITRSTRTNETTGVVTRTYSFRFYLESLGEEVADEPA